MKEIFLIRPNLLDIPQYSLPSGYSFKMYEPGDQENWYRIHKAADRYNITNPILFDEYFTKGADSLDKRQFYICNEDGLAVGTASAWFANFDGIYQGRLHWVAIIPEYQGKGLAKPLISRVLNRMVELKHDQAYLRTINLRFNAIGLYLHFGFRPWIPSDKEKAIWLEIATHVKHESLDFLKK